MQPTSNRSIESYLWGALEKAGVRVAVQKDTVVFMQGTKASGLFLVCSGRIRLRAVSNGMMEESVAQGGSVIELPTAMDGLAFSRTATVLEDSQVIFVPRDVLMQLFHNDALVCLGLAQKRRDQEEDFAYDIH